MDYKELAKVFYMDSSSNREANLAAEEARRRDSVGTFRLGYETQTGELFRKSYRLLPSKCCARSVR